MRRSISMLRGKKGFTLIELIVVLAVLAIIMAIAVPRFSGVREQAKVDADMATLASIAKLAEFEYVRQNLDTETALPTGMVMELIGSNFAEDDIFQTIDYDAIDVVFDNGKVTTIDVDGEDYTYANGKVSPPVPAPVTP